MPFINETAKRSIFQQAAPDTNIKESTFGDTFNASLGLTIDENLSISSAFNREGWQNRQELIRKKSDEGLLDREKYLDSRGRFDYNRAATDLNDPEIKTDDVLEQERSAMLGRRRKYAEDVIARGNGIAQFLGAANAYMLDPISIATMPIALAANGAKSLGIAGRALLTARNAAIVEGATELAIQPFVFEHKHDIDSPYTYKDALVNIGSAAIGAGVLGGVAGGVSGYIKKVRAKVEAGGVVTPEVDFALESLARMEESINHGRAARPTRDAAMADYDKLIQGEYDSFAEAANNTVKELESQAAFIRKDGQTVKKFIQDMGGVDRAIAKAEGIDPASFKAQGAKPVFRKTGGRTPDEIAEALNEIGFRGGNLDANDAVKIIDDISRGTDDFINPEHKARLDFIDRQVDELTFRSDEEYLEGIYKGAREADVQSDIDYLDALEVQRQISGRPTAEPVHYAEPPRQKAQKASVSQRESFMLDESGLADDFDFDMQRFNELESPKIIEGEELVDAGDFMKSIDDELEGIDSVLTCAYG